MAKVQTSKILSKVKGRAKGAFQRVRDNVPQAKGGTLPAGLSRAIARFSGYKLAETEDKHDPYASLTGIVVKPEEHKGKRATVTTYFVDTSEKEWGKTVEQRIDEFLNNVKLMGADISSCDDLDDVLPVLDEFAKEPNYFSFDTWASKATKQYPNPRVNIQIQGPASFDEETTEEVEDDEAGEEPETEEAEAEESKPAAKAGSKKGGKTKPAAVEPEAEEPETEEEEVEEEETEEAEAEAEEEWQPKPPEIYFYKNGKLAKAKYTVRKVDLAKQTVDVEKTEAPNKGKAVKGVPWTELLSE